MAADADAARAERRGRPDPRRALAAARRAAGARAELRLELVELTEPAGHQLELLAAGAEDRSRLREGCARCGRAPAPAPFAPSWRWRRGLAFRRARAARTEGRVVARFNAPRAARVEANFDGTPWRSTTSRSRSCARNGASSTAGGRRSRSSARYFEVVLETGENTVVFHDGAERRLVHPAGA